MIKLNPSHPALAKHYWYLHQKYMAIVEKAKTEGVVVNSDRGLTKAWATALFYSHEFQTRGIPTRKTND